MELRVKPDIAKTLCFSSVGIMCLLWSDYWSCLHVQYH